MGFRPDGIKSGGMAARTPWQAATAAAGEVTKRSDLGVSSAGSFLVPQHRGAGGDRSGRHGVVIGLDDEFVFTMDTPVDRFFHFFSLELFEVYYLRPRWRNRES